MAEWMVLGSLMGLSIYDIKTKRVPQPVVVLSGAAVLLYRLCTDAGVLEVLPGLIPGAALLLVSVCTRESIGLGDGMVLCVLGMFCGLRAAWAVLGMALVCAAILAMVLLVIKRAGRKTELPFLPCLCSGYLLYLLW